MEWSRPQRSLISSCIIGKLGTQEVEDREVEGSWADWTFSILARAMTKNVNAPICTPVFSRYCPPQLFRNASIGLIADARRAGTYPDAIATTNNVAAIPR